jgi:hypothetical protein
MLGWNFSVMNELKNLQDVFERVNCDCRNIEYDKTPVDSTT